MTNEELFSELLKTQRELSSAEIKLARAQTALRAIQDLAYQSSFGSWRGKCMDIANRGLRYD